MKLIAPIALTAVSAQATFDTISYRFRDSVQELAALFIQDASFASQVFSHGCWCAKLSDPSSVNLGGNAPVDELDQICKDWARARRCSRQNGASCEFAGLESSYEVERDNGATLCPDADSCMSETCQIDVLYISMMNDWRVANPQAFNPVANPVCPPHTTNQLNNCQAFPTTARPTTTAATQATADPAAIANAIDDVMGPSTCTAAADCIQFSLYWENRVEVQSELDMWVTEPSGEQIGWSHGSSATGGQLDYDGGWSDYQAVENIQWTSNPPVGTYNVQVHNYDSALASTGATCTTANPCPTVRIYVRVVANGVTTVFEFDLNTNTDLSYSGGSIFSGSYVNLDVYTFQYTSATRNQAATLTYTGPGIDYSLRH